MATAWGPRISATVNDDGVTIPDATAKVVASVGPVSATEVNYRVWVHAQLQVAANADVSAIQVQVLRGIDAGGDVIETVAYLADAFMGDGSALFIDAVDDLGPGGEQVSYVVALTMIDASGASSSSSAVMLATVF